MQQQTLLISQPAHLSLKHAQLIIYLKETKQTEQRPVEDLAFVVLEHGEITLTQQVLAYLGSANVAVICCDQQHMPNAMLLSLNAHHLQQTRFHEQINSTLPLKKQLWKRTVQAKIAQQAVLLREKNRAKEAEHLLGLRRNVQSGDKSNVEAQAARIYWKSAFGKHFVRHRYGPFPNNLLNYGYAILRAAMARALAGHGLLATLGIHHCNQYNAFCLADDMMEPYRAFVDAAVMTQYEKAPASDSLSRAHKIAMLQLLTADARWHDERTTVGNALSKTAYTLVLAFQEKDAKYLSFATL